MLQHGVEHFPRVALFWRLYAEHERATRGPEVAWKLLNENEERALCWCRCDADLWRVAAECCRDAHPREERASESTELVGRTFERAVAAAGALAAQRDGLFVVCWSVVYGLTPRQACGVFV